MGKYIPRPLQVKRMTDAIRKNRRPHTRRTIPMQILWVPRLHHLKVNGEVADVTSYVRARHFIETGPGTLKRLEHDFQQLSLLRIHVGRLDRADAEEVRVEGARILLQKITTRGVHGSRSIHTLGVVESINVEST